MPTDRTIKERETQLNPNEFVAITVNQATGVPTVTGLRAKPENYQWFCETYMKCVIPVMEWKHHSRKKPLSKVVTGSLEAFAVVVYVNGYKNWNERWKVDPSSESGSISTVSTTTTNNSPTVPYRFTGNSKGSKRFQGWEREGIDIYNGLVALIRDQRASKTCKFEHNLLQKLATTSRREKKKGADGGGPKALNDLDDLKLLLDARACT